MLVKARTLQGAPSSFRGVGIAATLKNFLGSIEVGRVFGQTTSIPRGFSKITAIRLPLKASGESATRLFSVFSLGSSLVAQGNAESVLSVVATLDVTGNVLSNGYSLFESEYFFTGVLKASGNVSVVFDILARPSAFDITQEIWNASVLSFQGAGTMGLLQTTTEKQARLAAALSA